MVAFKGKSVLTAIWAAAICINMFALVWQITILSPRFCQTFWAQSHFSIVNDIPGKNRPFAWWVWCVCVCASMGRRLSGYALDWSMHMCIKCAYSASTTSGLTCIHIFHSLSLSVSLTRCVSSLKGCLWFGCCLQILWTSLRFDGNDYGVANNRVITPAADCWLAALRTAVKWASGSLALSWKSAHLKTF